MSRSLLELTQFPINDTDGLSAWIKQQEREASESSPSCALFETVRSITHAVNVNVMSSTSLNQRIRTLRFNLLSRHLLTPSSPGVGGVLN
jgi:hypothetical protein